MKNTFDLIVLGAGSGGLAAAKRAASYGAKVAIIEGDLVGGTCVIRGCVPKKLLVYGSKYAEYLNNAKGFGVQINGAKFDLEQLLLNVREEVFRLNRLHIDLLEKSNVNLFQGWGKFTGPNSVCIKDPINQQELEICSKHILIAVGGKPVRPNILGSNLGWVSDDLFLQRTFPKKIVILGAGFIACEFACILNNLGVDVIQLVRGNSLLKGFDQELSTMLKNSMQREGIDIRFSEKIDQIKGEIGALKVFLQGNQTIDCGAVLFATGREPFLNGLNLSKAGVEFSSHRVKVDQFNLTSAPNIYAVGDVTDRINLTPVAIEEGRVFADRVFGNIERKIDYKLIPKAVFSQPEVASVGLSEEAAIALYGSKKVQIHRSRFRPMSQSLSKNNHNKCLLKLVVHKLNKKIVGCHMLGENSAEIIQMASIAISMGARKTDFDKTMALHPTIAEEFVTMT